MLNSSIGNSLNLKFILLCSSGLLVLAPLTYLKVTGNVSVSPGAIVVTYCSIPVIPPAVSTFGCMLVLLYIINNIL